MVTVLLTKTERACPMKQFFPRRLKRIRDAPATVLTLVLALAYLPLNARLDIFLSSGLIRLQLSKGHCLRFQITHIKRIDQLCLHTTLGTSSIQACSSFYSLSYAYLAPLSPMHCFAHPSMPYRACPSIIYCKSQLT